MFGVLVVGADDTTSDQIRLRLPESEGYIVSTAAGAFEVGCEMTRENLPRIVVIDFALGRTAALDLCARMVAKLTRYAAARIVALANEDETNEAELTAAGFNHVLKKPFDFADLVEIIVKRVEKMKQY
jgi:DNA-binding response OmpR family regulator